MPATYVVVAYGGSYYGQSPYSSVGVDSLGAALNALMPLDIFQNARDTIFSLAALAQTTKAAIARAVVVLRT